MLVVGFAGGKGSGKNHITSKVIQALSEYDTIELAYATALKYCVYHTLAHVLLEKDNSAKFDYNWDNIYKLGDRYKLDEKLYFTSLEGRPIINFRQILQVFGTDYIRDYMKLENFWVDYIKHKLEGYSGLDVSQMQIATANFKASSPVLNAMLFKGHEKVKILNKMSSKTVTISTKDFISSLIHKLEILHYNFKTNYRPDICFLTDVRFLNEKELISDYFKGIVFYIHRIKEPTEASYDELLDKIENIAPLSLDSHSSETQMLEFKKDCIEVINIQDRDDCIEIIIRNVKDKLLGVSNG